MDFKVKNIKWMGNIYQKFEAVCQEVDDIVSQDAVKYLENGVQNVGGSVKKFYSGVVHELLPFPKLVNPTKLEAQSVALINNIISSVKSVGGGEDNNKKRDKHKPINNFTEDCKEISLGNYQQAGAPNSVKSVCGGKDNHKNGNDEKNSNNVTNVSNHQQVVAPDSVKSVGGGEDNHKYEDEETHIKSCIKALQDSDAISLAMDQEAGVPNSVKSVGGTEDNNVNWDEENSIDNFFEALQDSNVNNLANDQQAGAPDSVKSVGGAEDNHTNRNEENSIDNFFEASQDSNAINLANDQQVGAPESVKSVGGGEDNQKNGDEGNPIDNFIEALHDSNVINLANDQQVGAPDSVKSVGGAEDNQKNGDEEIPVDNFIELLQDSNAISLSNDQQAGPDMHELVYQTSSETCLDSLEVDASYVTQKEVADDLRETAGVKKETIHAIAEETAIKSAPELMNLTSVKEKGPLEFSLHSESHSGAFNSACRVLVSTKDNKTHDTNSSAAQVLNSMSLGEKELTKASLFRKSSGVDKEDTGKLAKVSAPLSSVSCKSTKTGGPLCFRSSIISDSPYSGDVRCEFPQVAGQVMKSHNGLVSSSSFCQSKELKDELLVSSIESRLEDIQLNDDTNLEKSCVFVDDKELHEASRRVQKLRSYKERIHDALTSKKRAKEFEQLAIWYGDTDFESKQDLPPQTHLPFRSKTWGDIKQLRMQQASETEWELL